jgi:hypothetical protein
MREALDQWTFVIAAYAVVAVGTVLLAGWSWLAMRGAERRRDETRRLPRSSPSTSGWCWW